MADEQPALDFWEQYNDTTAFIEVECEGEYDNLAHGVLSYYNIPTAGGTSSIGGKLENIDIKRMDAMSVIKMSLMEQSAEDGTLYETIVNTDGEVEFKEVGGDTASLNNIYHQMQTSAYVEKCKGVMVQGSKPLPTRKPTEWKPIWGSNPDDRTVYDTTNMHNNCLKDNFSNYAVIAFRDPHVGKGESQYEDGIDNLYELTSENPWESIMGYVYFLNIPDNLSTPETSVSLTSTCSIPIQIGSNGEDQPPELGNLQRHPVYTEIEGGDPVDHPDCWAGLGMTADYNDGVEVVIPEKFRFEDVRDTKVDNYDGISAVYVIGIELSTGVGHPINNADAIQEDDALINYSLVLTPTSTSTSLFRLSEGEHYVVAYREDGDNYKHPYIVFANNSRIGDPANFGTNISFKWDTSSEMYRYNPGEQFGSILPTSSNGAAMLVKEIWVKVDLNTPSITVFDPSGNVDGVSRAKTIAEELDFLVAPIVIEAPPAPLAFNGRIIDQSQSIQDHDPTTTQNFEDTEYELALDMMEGGGTSITMNCLNEDQCATLSETLYNFMNSGDGVFTVYTCGPDTEVELCDTGPAGGIINNITYNYTDSSSYTIGVTEGPRLVGGLSDVVGDSTPKLAEEISANGTIIQDMGNNVHFKVRIDGFGERVAINTMGRILRVGDKVSCSIHNNPVES